MKVLISLLTLGAFLPGGCPAAVEKPNLVFILADDLGWSDTTLDGHLLFNLRDDLSEKTNLARR